MKKVTIVLPISRPDRVVAVANIVDTQIIPAGYEANLVIVLDNTDVDLQLVNEKFGRLAMKKKVFQFDRAPAGEFNSMARRDRICEVFAKAAEMVPFQNEGDFVFGLEDDTEVPGNTIEALVQDYHNIQLRSEIPNIGLITALEAGRWGFKYIGAWQVDRLQDPTTIETIPFRKEALIDEIDAGGFYAFLTPAHLFKAHKFTWHDECFGPDVVYGLSLREQGYRNFADWMIQVTHRVTGGGGLRVDDQCVVVRYRKNEAGKWNLEGVKK